MTIQRVSSKWSKTNVLVRSETLRESVPSTKKWSRDTLGAMLDDYSMVYVKPESGTFGNGVIRVEKRAAGGYSFQLGTNKHFFDGLDAIASRLQAVIGSRSYLIQRGIQLLRHSGRRFDIRVMVQKNERNEWESTGIIGRLGKAGKIVTNYHSGATPMAIEKLMRGHLNESQTAAFKSRLRRLGVAAARQLQTEYPRLKEIGVDVAVDYSLKPWILEVNTLPDPYIFKKLKDKSVFRKVYRYCVHYGRFKSSRRKA